MGPLLERTDHNVVLVGDFNRWSAFILEAVYFWVSKALQRVKLAMLARYTVQHG